MKVYYSPSTKGFYNTKVHKTIPQDVVEITEQDRINLIEEQSTGKIIVFNAELGVVEAVNSEVQE